MQEHQKYFPVVNGQGELQPNFIAIANIESREPEQVRAGNERVIRPRFSDAAFFWEQDLKQPLEAQISSLKTVVFQERLGSLHDKSQRIANLAREIADRLGMDPSLAERAAKLCKCDLMTQMVGEFPSLQGTMGRHYAQAGGEPPQVVAAMEEHYLPRHAGDRLPQTACGQSLAIADRLDTLMGIFAIGQKPSGVKDPFGLRRAALGVLRILIETPLDLDLEQLLRSAAANLETRVSAGHVVPEVFDYMMDRLKAYYGDRGMAADLVDAVLAQRPTRPNDLDRRIKAVDEFRRLPEAASLAAANKRIRNILRKAQDEVPHRPVIELLRDRSEKELARLVSDHAERVAPLFRAGQYTEALTQLAQLREPVDRFFDEVMVMCDEPDLRRNRLALLASLEALFLGAADLSRLQ
jgi:glycyl-tRNA synthetase beta chain